VCYDNLPTDTELETFQKTTWWKERCDHAINPIENCRQVSCGVEKENLRKFIRKTIP
jgi:hypothetical protein